jgi:hypothetical protein
MAINAPERPTETAPVARPPVDAHPSPVASEGRSGKATTSMVLGIVGILGSFIPLLGWILGGVALGLGLSARGQARRGGLPGAGRATAGIVLGVIAIVAGLAFAAVNVAIMT